MLISSHERDCNAAQFYLYKYILKFYSNSFVKSSPKTLNFWSNFNLVEEQGDQKIWKTTQFFFKK